MKILKAEAVTFKKRATGLDVQFYFNGDGADAFTSNLVAMVEGGADLSAAGFDIFGILVADALVDADEDDTTTSTSAGTSSGVSVITANGPSTAPGSTSDNIMGTDSGNAKGGVSGGVIAAIVVVVVVVVAAGVFAGVFFLARKKKYNRVNPA